MKKRTFTFTLPTSVRRALNIVSDYNRTNSSSQLSILILNEYRKLQKESDFIDWQSKNVTNNQDINSI